MTEIMSEERLTRDEMASLQLRRLRETLSYAKERVGFYRQLFQEHSMTHEDITSLDQIAGLPFTKKSDLVQNYPYGMCAVDPSEIIRLHASSGTTGKPINTYYTRKDQQDWQKCMERNFRIAGITKDDVCQIAFRYTLFTGAFGHHLGAESCGAMVIPTSAGQTERQIMMMQDLKTTVLHCTPSYALVVAEKLKESGIDPQSLALRLGIHGAEPMSEEMRQHIEEGLGVTALRDYGLTEVGGPGVSMECPSKSGFHINEDYFYPEIIDPNTLEPLPPGEIGELVFTSLQKEAMPLIRYRTRDITHLMYDTCACGRTLVRHGPICGRTDDMLIVGGVNFFPSQLESILLAFSETAPHYALYLRKKGPVDDVSVEVETLPEFWALTDENSSDRLMQRIEGKIKDILGFRIHVRLMSPNSIPRSEGKSKRVFDER
ncbi:MAG: phenylacetate--CoA ligase [Desulfomonile tiedjei]|uniref:Phenylacetate-coenzyme A ligase n=1 Tax=Desulfomonile tiedjei TaxID=2358 RepID=A0A9D6YZS3_9BACT|nr:phenylacetate--CoA ligase [Desulfomonile tiedjei]